MMQTSSAEVQLSMVFLSDNVDKNRVKLIFGEDCALYIKILVHFYDQLRGEFAHLVEDVRTQKPFAPTHIHTLKGVSGNLGLVRLADICTRIDACYKASKPILEALILELESVLSSLRQELSMLKKEEVEVLDDAHIKTALCALKQRLNDAELIKPQEQAPLIKALEHKVDAQQLSLWSDALDALNYSKALEIMNTWDICEERVNHA